MHPSTLLSALFAIFTTLASSQQYAGEVIETSLLLVPGSEIAFFKIPGFMDSNKKKAANLTLINYYSHGSDGKRLVESKIQRAVIVIHGLNRDPGTYESNMLSALAQVTGDGNVGRDSVAVLAPFFANGDDKTTGYPWTNGLAAQRGSTTSALVWKGSQWAAGGNNQYPYYSQATSSYTVLDTLLQYFDDKTLFPNMKQIVVAGHSLGAQTVQRYAALGQKLNTQSPVTFWIGNPNSYVWLSTVRPLSTASCPMFDYYREGYTNFTEYPMTYGQSLVSQGRSAILANFNSKQIAFARGTQDNGDDSSSCAPLTTGVNRNERFFNFTKAFPVSCPDPRGANCDTVDLVNMGHDAGGMFASPAGRARLFTDSFYGNGNRSYDFGYPRQQSGDDPFPDPTLNATSSSLNNDTYAGNLTYAGCWSDSGSARTFPIQAYDNSANTIELCTSTCVSRGYSIAGIEYGSQCFCGNAMTSGAVKVIESSCTTLCAGNSSESCGGYSRLSVFSNGVPYVLAPASNPETVGKFYYSNCYTETNSRALSAKRTSGDFMTLEYCADYCFGYRYFGTEYSSECYCGNTIDPLSSITNSNECSMTCANNTLQYCGAGNRLTLFTSPDYVQPTGSSTSSAPSTPTASGVAGPACPASDNTVVTSNGLNFTIECSIDHSGGDLTSVQVSSFQQCIDACSSNSKCVDVSLSGSACYLKQVLGSAVNAPAIWGAKLIVGGSSSSTSAAASSTTATSASRTVSTTPFSSPSPFSRVPTTNTPTSSASSSATATPSATSISCPFSNATTYTGPSGKIYTIECGIDHQGGDMGSKSVGSFQQCIDACDRTVGCVDVSLSGTACYLKSSLGPAINAPGIWGARLLVASETSSGVVSSSGSGSASATASSILSLVSGSSSTGVSSSISSSSSSASSTSTYAPSSTSSSSSATSATPTAISCPASNNTLYTVVSGNNFLIECGIDHQGADLSSKGVKSFAECIALCDTTPNCIDVAMSGDMCYLKSSVGPVVRLDYVWGAKLVVASSSSSSATSGVAATSLGLTSSSSSSSLASSSTLETSWASSASSASSALSASSTSPFTSSALSVSSTASVSSTSTPSSMPDPTTMGTISLTTPSTSVSASSSASTSTSSDSSVSLSTSSLSIITSAQTTSPGSSGTGLGSPASDSSSTSSSAMSTLQTTLSLSTSSTSDITTRPTISTSSTTSSSAASSSSSTASLTSGTITTSSTISNMVVSASSTLSASVSSTSTIASISSGSSTITSSTTSLVASSSAVPLPFGFSYAGCFNDPASGRAFPVSNGSSATQTQQQCAKSCQAQGYRFSGTEYASECWCGGSLPSSSAPDSQCNMACKGDSTQKCGAGNRLSVVSDDTWKQTFFARQSFGAWNLLGCYTDSTAKRSLPNSVSLSAFGGAANATVSNCIQACQARGFSYCGEEYYSECYGSNVAPTTSLAGGADPLAAGCNYPCKGNSIESCGGSSRIIVYSNVGQ